jgi:molecular chaperone HscB
VLKARQKRVLLKSHPDRFVGKSEQEKRIALQYSSLANEAYQTLSNPLTRAVYLLNFLDVPTDLQGSHSLPMPFLMKQMEIRELLEAAGSDRAKLAGVEIEIKQRREKLIDNLEKLFAENTKESLQQAQAFTLQLAFYKRLLNEVAEKL